MIAKEKIKEIQKQFNRVIEYSQGFSPNTDLLFEEWERNKKRLMDCNPSIAVLFQDSLTKEYEVEFHLDNQKKEDLVEDFLNQMAYYINAEEYSNFYQFVKLNRNSFFENLVVDETFTFGAPIKAGMKLLKSFKYFISDKETLTNVQQIASSIIQKDKIKGTFVFSIHPLDYLSASETTYKWRSCHSLDGEYRAGNLSYMTDTATICCYIKGEDNVKLPNFPDDVPWNSKKWRMWIHRSLDTGLLFFGRQYPFSLEKEVLYFIVKNLRFSKYNLTNFYLNKIKDPERDMSVPLEDKYIEIRSRLYPISSVVADCGCHYSDLLNSSFYTPYYAYKSSYNKQPLINIGNEVKCLYCNENYIEKAEGEMVCNSCIEKGYGSNEGRIQCPCCNRYFTENHLFYFSNIGNICEECTEEYTSTCACCDEVYLLEDLIYDEEYGHVCEDCHYQIEESRRNKWVNEGVGQKDLI